jgi:hypothetical protein
MAQSWAAGEGLPDWSPLIIGGMSLAATPLAMLAYPPAWLFLFLPTEPVFNLFFVLHLFWGGLGAYLLLGRGFGLSPQAALLGGLAFGLNSKFVAHTAGGHVSMMAAVSWLPWAVWGMHMLLAAPGWRAGLGWLSLTSAALAMQIATHSQILLYTAYLLGAMTLFQASGVPGPATHRRRHLADGLARFMVALLLAALLGAAQLLPQLELAGLSSRGLDAAQAGQYALSPLQLLLGLGLPAAQGGHETIIYLGWLPLLLLPSAFSRANRWSWFYGGVLAVALLFALGEATPLHALVYRLLPGFQWVRTPARLMFMGALAAAVLTGFGLERLNTARWSGRATHRAGQLALALGLLALLLGLGLALGLGQVQRAGLALAVIVPAGLAVIVLRLRRRVAAPLTAGLLALLLLLDLLWFDYSLLRFIPPAQAFAPGQPAAEFLAAQPGRFRVYSPSYSLPMPTAAAYRLRLVDGVEPARLARYDELMARAGGYPNQGYSVTIPNFGGQPLATALAQARPNLKLLGLLNVGYLAAAFPIEQPGLSLLTELEGTNIYANPSVLPPAWVAYQSRPTEADWLGQLAALPHLADIVTIEQGPSLPPSEQRAGAATIIAYGPNRLEVETDTLAPAWLVLSEVWYPGWRATVNGIGQPVARVDGLLRGCTCLSRAITG